MLVLGVPVSVDLHTRWRRWLAPELQPFFVSNVRGFPKSRPGPPALGAELSHTYRTWRVDRSLDILWLDEPTFLGMDRSKRAALVRAQVGHRRGAVPSVRRWSNLLEPATLRSQGDGRRFVWWPSLVATNPHDVLARVVAAAPEGAEVDALPSRHREVAGVTWDRCQAKLPGAKRVAGSFPWSSGPNCFGTVMAAAGVTGAADECMLQPPFVAWLESACQPGGHDDDPGTVLVWRDPEGVPVHAAVTIGDGWALEKASGEWWTPRAVRTVGDVIRASRARGQRLERHCITTASKRLSPR